jgi:adhesin HecA-like repeat protein
VVVESTGSRVDVSGATVNADGTLTVKGQTTATLDDATIDHNQNSGGLSVDVDAVSDDASLQGARVTSLVPVTIDAGGDVLAADATVDTSGAYDKSVTVTAAGKVDTTGGTITTQGPVTLTASGGDVIAPGTSVDTSGAYGMEIRIESTADVDVSSSTLRTNSGRILADLAKRSTVSVGGATFSGYDRNGRGNNANGVDELVVTPKQVTQNGTPGSGEVVFTNNP